MKIYALVVYADGAKWINCYYKSEEKAYRMAKKFNRENSKIIFAIEEKEVIE